MDCPACGSSNIITGKKWCICDDCGERFSAAEKAKGEESFHVWFRKKMEKLIAVAESPETLTDDATAKNAGAGRQKTGWKNEPYHRFAG